MNLLYFNNFFEIMEKVMEKLVAGNKGKTTKPVF